MPQFKFRVAVKWEVSDEIEISANTLEEAMRKVVVPKDGPFFDLPDGEFVENTFKVDEKLSKQFLKDDMDNGIIGQVEQ